MASNEEFIKKNKVVLIDDDKNTKLHYAAALNNEEEVKKIINSGHKPDPENYLGWTPLMMAVRNGHTTIIDFLLDNGANASKQNHFGASVFLMSVTSGSLKIVEKMLDHLLCGGTSRRILQREISPLSMSILFGHSQIFKFLLGRSFDPNAATPLTLITPAMFAVALGNHKAMKKLLEHNADPKLKNYLGKTAADILISRQQWSDIDGSVNKTKQPQVPLIMINSGDSPHLQLTPCVPTNEPIKTRKSSNVRTPYFTCTPDVTPIITPNIMQPVFFPADFSPSQYISPVAFITTDLLNANINSSAFFSPFSPQFMCLPPSGV